MKKNLILIAAALLLAGAVAYAQEAAQTTPPQTTPPQAPTPQNTQAVKDAKYTNDSIGHLSFVEGKAFVQRASDLGYEDAALNMPISEGDRIGTSDGRVEVHFGRGNYVRLDGDSKLDVLNLPKKDDDVARFRVWSGSAFLVIGSLKKEKAIELHTADSSFYVLDRGIYRVNVRENRDTEILVYQGLIEAAGEDGSTLLKASQKLEISEGRFTSKPESFIAVADDPFDKFNESRNSVTGQEMAKGKLPEELSDYEGELDQNGKWTYLAPYGDVWVPNGVDEDWRPYYNGRWSWLPLSGWTWWPYEPWGWSTFHYGRWHWGLDLGWYWIPMSMWGPAWVDWWWDDFYFGWAPLSYWGYPGVLYGGAYYGGYYGDYYPAGSRALTVVRRDHLKDPHIAANALRGDALKGLNKISLTSPTLSLRPAGTKISVEPLNGNRVMLRNDGTKGLTRDTRLNGAPTAGTAGPRAIRRPDAPSTGKTATQGKTTGATVKSPSRGERSSGSGRTTSSGGRNIRKKDPSASASAAGYGSDPSIAGTSSRVGTGRTVNGYPSSPSIRGPQSYGDGGAGRARVYGGPTTRSSGSSVGRSTSGRTGKATTRSSGSRVSSGKSSGSSSRGSVSRGSSGSSSRGSSGSRGGGGSVRRR